MKQFLPTFFACLISGIAFAQMDTVLFEDFQNVDLLALPEFPDSPDTDSLWINWDEDALDTDQGNFGDSRFVQALAFESPDSIPPEDTMVVAAAQSWLVGFDTSSSNWLITPAIDITNDSYVLSWKSSPRQGPRYMDGYSVKILIGSSFYDEADQLDVVFRAAEMDGAPGVPSTDPVGSLNPASHTYTNGMQHASGWTDSLYFIAPEIDSTGLPDAASNTGALEPFSVDLSAYAGQTVYVAFHHDSADDFLIAFDDILLVATDGVTSTVNIDAEAVNFYTYPNPVANRLNVLYNVEEAAQVRLEVYNQAGQVVMRTPQQLESGRQNKTYDLSRLPAGTYHVSLWLGDRRATKTVVRR